MTNFGYDSFVIEDNYYNDSFYNDMSESINVSNSQISLNNNTEKNKSSFQSCKDSISSCNCYGLKKQLNQCKQMFYSKVNEIEEIKAQTFMLYILLIISVFIIITQRMNINNLNNLIYIFKLSNGFKQSTIENTFK